MKNAVTADTDKPLEQQRLVNLMDRIRHYGNITRENGEVAIGEHGAMWTDLPLFKPSIQDMLQTTFDRMSSGREDDISQWRNLNGFAIRLAVTQICDLRVGAVLAMRNVLEEQHTITPTMVEVVSMWVAFHGVWLETLVFYTTTAYGRRDRRFMNSSHSVSVPAGKLAFDAGIKTKAVSQSRWRFWRSKLQLLASDGSDDGASQSVSTMARMTLNRLEEV